MKKDIHNNNLKQIVTKEFVQDLTTSELDGHGEIAEAGSIKNLQVISDNKEAQLSQEEKNILKQKIENSIHAQKSRSIVFRWASSAAAIAVLVVSSFLVVQNMSSSSITEYAKNFDDVAFDGNTHLYLGLNESIDINTEDAEIKHLGRSSEIEINSNNKIEQELEINEVIYNTVFVPFGKKSKIVLSDNSTIWLNSGSKFIYPAKFSDKRREVFLEGEAVFDVAENKQKPFVVITNDIEVKVLGTVFNVSAYPSDDYTGTALVSGSVEINFKKSFFQTETIHIVPGTVAIFNKASERIIKQKENVNKYTSWRDGILILEEEPLQNIANKLSRFHNIAIEIEGEKLAQETFSGRLEFTKSVEQTLKTINEIVDFEISSNEHKIIISQK